MVKRVPHAVSADGSALKKGQWTWSKHGGPSNAWEAVKAASHWNGPIPILS